jgi:hypothetical protein
MDVVLWILIGLAAGASIASLMPEIQPWSLSGAAGRGVQSMLAGLVGAVAAGYALVFFDPAMRTAGLTTALASLTGALWLAGIVAVYSSRHQPGNVRGRPTPDFRSPSSPIIEMPAYNAARSAVIAGLIEDALAHEAGRYADIGRGLPAIRDTVDRQDPLWNSRLQLAVRFWSGWAAARDEGWQAGAGTPIAFAEWPRFARSIASDLACDHDTMDRTIVSRFAYATDARV